MAGRADFVEFFHDFLGATTFVATADSGSDLFWKKTGSPTSPALVTPGTSGECALALPATNEAENSSFTWNDKLLVDVTKLRIFECKVKLTAALAATVNYAFGVIGAANDAPTSVAQACLLHGVGDAASNKLTCRTINTTLTVSKTTTETLEATYKVLQIDFSNRANVKFYSNGARLKTNQIFDWSAATGGCQPPCSAR